MRSQYAKLCLLAESIFLLFYIAKNKNTKRNVRYLPIPLGTEVLKEYLEILWSEVHFSPPILILLHIQKELYHRLTSFHRISAETVQFWQNRDIFEFLKFWCLIAIQYTRSPFSSRSCSNYIDSPQLFILFRDQNWSKTTSIIFPKWLNYLLLSTATSNLFV